MVESNKERFINGDIRQVIEIWRRRDAFDQSACIRREISVSPSKCRENYSGYGKQVEPVNWIICGRGHGVILNGYLENVR